MFPPFKWCDRKSPARRKALPRWLRDFFAPLRESVVARSTSSAPALNSSSANLLEPVDYCALVAAQTAPQTPAKGKILQLATTQQNTQASFGVFNASEEK